MTKLTHHGLDAVLSQSCDNGSDEVVLAQDNLSEVFDKSTLLKEYLHAAVSQVLGGRQSSAIKMLLSALGVEDSAVAISPIVRAAINFGILWERNTKSGAEFEKLVGVNSDDLSSATGRRAMGAEYDEHDKRWRDTRVPLNPADIPSESRQQDSYPTESRDYYDRPGCS
jgi:hypothetical protein